MSSKLRRALLSTLIAASVAVLVAAPAEARRGTPPSTQPGYVPPYGVDPDFEPEPDPYAGPTAPVAPTVESVELSPDPAVHPSGGGTDLGPAPADAPQVLPDTEQRSEAPEVQPVKGGVFANTGAETLPLVRAGLAAITLGVGLVMLGRRRRQAAATA